MPESSTLLAALGLRLKGARYEIEADNGSLIVSGPDGTDKTAITCEERADDAGTLWFFADGVPLAEAEQMAWALTALQTRLLDRRGE